MYFNTNLIYLRKKRNLSQAMVAKLFDLGTNTIGSYERGDREPTFYNLVRLAKFYEVSVDDLLTSDMCTEDFILGRNLKYLRKREKYTQEEMAHLLRYRDKSSYCLIENGETKLSVDKAVIVSEFFGVSVDDLLKKDLSKGGS